MNARSRADLDAFRRAWRVRLSERVRFELFVGPVPSDGLTASAKADAFAVRNGFQPIGFNWELLDPEADIDAPRSAFGTMVEAVQRDLSNPSHDWLDAKNARLCARQFLDAFAPAALTVLTNHLNGLWWPISDAADEWSFVALDDDAIALWLMAA